MANAGFKCVCTCIVLCVTHHMLCTEEGLNTWCLSPVWTLKPLHSGGEREGLSHTRLTHARITLTVNQSRPATAECMQDGLHSQLNTKLSKNFGT